MSEDLDKRLRAALRPMDPGEQFTARVLARAAEAAQGAQRAQDLTRAPLGHARLQWLPAALAASILAVVVVRHELRERRDAGRAAREQVLEALRVTSDKLDLAYQLVNASGTRRTDAPPGA